MTRDRDREVKFKKNLEKRDSRWSLIISIIIIIIVIIIFIIVARERALRTLLVTNSVRLVSSPSECKPTNWQKAGKISNTFDF